MQDSPKQPEIKPHVALLRAIGTELMLRGNALIAQAEALETATADVDDWLGLPELNQRYGLTRESLAAATRRGELSPKRGPKGRVIVRRSDVEAWLESRPWTPSTRQAPVADELEDWDAQAAAVLGGAQ